MSEINNCELSAEKTARRDKLLEVVNKCMMYYKKTSKYKSQNQLIAEVKRLSEKAKKKSSESKA